MRSLRTFTLAALLLSAGAARAADGESPYKFEFHGFVTGSLYMQDQVAGLQSGQGLIFFAPTPGQNAPCKTLQCQGGTIPVGAATKSGTFLAGDIRQSRYVLALSGPAVMAGATPKAYFEGDLLGGAGGPPLVESWVWRIRAAYAELKWTNFTFQAGQHSAQLAFAMLPDSVAHIANPYTFGAGNFGWRTLGARGFYTVPMGSMKFELAGSVAQGTWGDNNVPGAALNTISSAMATTTPQVEGRARVEGKSGPLAFNIYADALYNSVDLKGYGQPAVAVNVGRPGLVLADGTTKSSATVWAAELGGKLQFTPIFVAFNVYTGKSLGSLAGAMLQQGEIADKAFWVQAGVNLTKEFSLNATYGADMPDKTDVRNWAPTFANANPKSDNKLIAAQAKYLDGGYAFALEYIRYETTYLTGTFAAPTADIKTNMYQLIATAGYFF